MSAVHSEQRRILRGHGQRDVTPGFRMAEADVDAWTANSMDLNSIDLNADSSCERTARVNARVRLSYANAYTAALNFISMSFDSSINIRRPQIRSLFNSVN